MVRAGSVAVAARPTRSGVAIERVEPGRQQASAFHSGRATRPGLGTAAGEGSAADPVTAPGPDRPAPASGPGSDPGSGPGSAGGSTGGSGGAPGGFDDGDGDRHAVGSPS